MMDDRFKFRVFHKGFNEYLGDEWEISLNRDVSVNACRYDDSEIGIECEYAEKDRLVVEFCTSSKDKEGNFIYEGDIVSWAEDEAPFIVQYCERCGALTCHQPYATKFISTPRGEVPCDLTFDCGICEGNFSMSDQFYDVEIIGNIHQK